MEPERVWDRKEDFAERGMGLALGDRLLYSPIPKVQDLGLHGPDRLGLHLIDWASKGCLNRSRDCPLDQRAGGEADLASKGGWQEIEGRLAAEQSAAQIRDDEDPVLAVHRLNRCGDKSRVGSQGVFRISAAPGGGDRNFSLSHLAGNLPGSFGQLRAVGDQN
jgi:hypothetical protein